MLTKYAKLETICNLYILYLASYLKKIWILLENCINFYQVEVLIFHVEMFRISLNIQNVDAFDVLKF